MVRFVEIAYTGKTGEGVFDTTDPNVHPDVKPVILPVKEGILIKGLAEFLKDKGPGEYTATFKPEDAFGKKDPRLLQLIPKAEFDKAGLKPYVGLEIEADGARGRVISISGGRVTVDFNHPLAGKEVTYEIRILRDVTDPKETVPALLTLLLRIPENTLRVEVKDKEILIRTSLPEALHQTIKEVVQEYHEEYTVRVEAEKKEEKEENGQGEEKERTEAEEKKEGERAGSEEEKGKE